MGHDPLDLKQFLLEYLIINSKPMNFLKYTFFLLTISIILISCEEEFTPEISTAPPEIVVEGYIESGDEANPPFVLLTRSSPFFSEIDLDEFDNFFVHDAEITISDGSDEVVLTELCLNDLSGEQKEIAAELFGLDTDSLSVNFCVYLDLTFSMMGEEGKTYDLTVSVEDKVLTSTTTIPMHVPLDSLYLRPAPGEPNDTLRQMLAFIDDPAGVINYYRVFSGVNGEQPFAGFGSVFNDAFFDGIEFEFVLPKAERIDTDREFDELGLFLVGDTATIKWFNLDKEHYDFWNTLEFNAANQGPFSSYTRIASNIEGGLGVWGGASVSYYEIIVEE